MRQKKKAPPVRISARRISAIDELLAMSDETGLLETSDDLVDGDSDDDQHFSVGIEEKEIDIVKLLEDEFSTFRPVTKDLRIDDSHLPLARNFLEFTLSESFLNSPPYLEQALIGLQLLAEYCPRCSDLDWMAEDGHAADESLATLKSKVTILNHGVCPKCGARKTELIKSGELNLYNELVVVAGQRSGKSAVSTMISAYILHMYLKCPKPTELFGIRPNEILHGTFLALTLGQARENLWEPFYGYISNSPWFKAYHRMLRQYEKKFGEELFKLKDTFVLYRHRNIYMYAATPDKRVLRGRTRFLGVLDELGWFDANRDTKKVKDDAHGVYSATSNSLATVRQSEARLIELGYDQLLTGYMINVSSPSNIRDKIMELYKQSQGSKKMLGLHRPTWKMNPHLPRDSAVIEEEYRKNPIGAERDFGAQPSLSTHPFMSNHRLIEETVREKGRNYVKYALKISRISKDEKYRTAEVMAVKHDNRRSVMALDAGRTNNSFALAVGSIHEGIPHIDCLVEINALPGIPISFVGVFTDIVLPLIEERKVSILLADQWQSIKLLEDARATYPDQLKVSAQYSLKYTDMHDIKTAIEMGQFKIPKTDNASIKEILKMNMDDYPKCFEGMPVEHLLVQMATVVDLGKKKVDKGDGFTDDLFRASALCYWGLQNVEYQQFLDNQTPEEAARHNQIPLAVVKRYNDANVLTTSGGNKMYSGTRLLGYKRTTR